MKMKKRLAKIIEGQYIGFDIQTGNRFNADSVARYSWLTPTDSAYGKSGNFLPKFICSKIFS
jgi:hypothetical protein